MISTPHASLARCLAVAATATAGCGLLVGWLLPVAFSPDDATF